MPLSNASMWDRRGLSVTPSIPSTADGNHGLPNGSSHGGMRKEASFAHLAAGASYTPLRHRLLQRGHATLTGWGDTFGDAFWLCGWLLTLHWHAADSKAEERQFATLQQHIDELTQQKFELARGLEQQQQLAASLAAENQQLLDDFNRQVEPPDTTKSGRGLKRLCFMAEVLRLCFMAEVLLVCGIAYRTVGAYCQKLRLGVSERLPVRL